MGREEEKFYDSLFDFMSMFSKKKQSVRERKEK